MVEPVWSTKVSRHPLFSLARFFDSAKVSATSNHRRQTKRAFAQPFALRTLSSLDWIRQVFNHIDGQVELQYEVKHLDTFAVAQIVAFLPAGVLRMPHESNQSNQSRDATKHTASNHTILSANEISTTSIIDDKPQVTRNQT